MDGPSLGDTLKKVRASGRTPLIVSAFENPQTTEEVRMHMALDVTQEQHIYLRTLGLEMEEVGYEEIS